MNDIVKCYLGKDGYYETSNDFGDPECPKRPSEDHEWTGAEWVFSQALQDARLAREEAERQRPLDDLTLRAIVAGIADQLGVTPKVLRDKIVARLRSMS